MDFKKTILWSGRLYKLLEKVGLDNKFNLDNIIDNNFPQIMANLQTFAKFDKIAICQTNGKKTTTNILNQILDADDKTYITNVNYDAKKYQPLTSIILDIARGVDIFDSSCEKDHYVMAMNEFELDYYFNSMKFDYLLLGNLFIDQKDFAGLNEKRIKIQKAITLNSKLNLIINADEPMFHKIDNIKNDTILNKARDKFYYGFNNIEYCDETYTLEQKNDILKCPICGCDLDYKKRFYSHIGHYDCECGFKRPKLDLSADAKIFNDYTFLTVYYKTDKYVFRIPLGGIHNAYNALGAIAVAINLEIKRKTITEAFENYKGLKSIDDTFLHKNKQIKIKTVKNPVSLTNAVRELFANKITKVVFALSDTLQDGVDTSWIWDANFDSLRGFENKIYVTSNRFDDMALRLKQAGVNPSLIIMEGSLKNAINCCYWELQLQDMALYHLSDKYEQAHLY